MKFVATRVEVLLSLAFLWIVSAILWPPVSYFNKGAAMRLDASDPSNTAAYALFAAFLAGVAVVRRAEMLRGVRSAWPVLALVALAYLSAFWSDAPELVLRRATTLAITTLFAVYLIMRFDLGRLVAMLVSLNAVAVVGSFAIAAVA